MTPTSKRGSASHEEKREARIPSSWHTSRHNTTFRNLGY